MRDMRDAERAVVELEGVCFASRRHSIDSRRRGLHVRRLTAFLAVMIAAFGIAMTTTSYESSPNHWTGPIQKEPPSSAATGNVGGGASTTCVVGPVFIRGWLNVSG